MNKLHFGSCLCEQIKFEITGNFDHFYLCHCKHCQKDTGSAHAANLFSTSAKISWLTGKEKIKTYLLPLTRHAKSFCSDCGSALPNLQVEGQLLVVPAGSLNSTLTILPEAHIFFSSKACWEEGFENIKKFEQYPT